MMSNKQPSGAAMGWITFAGLLMIIGGSFAALAGLAGILNPGMFSGTDSVIEQSADAWGWWHLFIGAVIFFAGFGVFTGNLLARTIGVIAASVGAISTFVWLPIAPVWGIAVITMDIAVIWALTAHGRDIQKAEEVEQLHEMYHT